MKKAIELNNHQVQPIGPIEEGARMSVEVDYSDEDIILIDNANEMVKNYAVRMKMNAVVVCFEGSAQADFNSKTLTISRNQMLIVPSYAKINHFLFSVDFRFKALLLNDNVIQRLLRPAIGIWNHALYVNQMKVRQLSDKDIRMANKLCETIQFGLDYTSNPYQKEIMHSFIQGALLGLCGILSEEKPVGQPIKAQTGYLFPRFLDLLQNSKVKHRQVTNYAAQLFVSPKYLSIVCKQHSGKTALQWIEEYTLADVDYYLRSTDRSIKEVANLLGFPNASFFGKYVKEHLLISVLLPSHLVAVVLTTTCVDAILLISRHVGEYRPHPQSWRTVSVSAVFSCPPP